MTTLQLGLIVGGIALVVGVIIYNWLQERRVRRRIAATFSAAGASGPGSQSDASRGAIGGGRVEPTPRNDALDSPAAAPAGLPENPPRAEPAAQDDEEDVEYVHPVEFAPPSPQTRMVAEAPAHAPRPAAAGKASSPDPDVECIILLEPEGPVAAGELAAGLHARVGKPRAAPSPDRAGGKYSRGGRSTNSPWRAWGLRRS
jgi:hypothetical protein